MLRLASLVEADLAWSDEHLGCFWNWTICFLFLWVALPLWATAVVMAIQWVTASLRVSMQSACQPLRYVWAWGDPGDSQPSLLSSPHFLLNSVSFPCPCYSAPGSNLQHPVASGRMFYFKKCDCFLNTYPFICWASHSVLSKWKESPLSLQMLLPHHPSCSWKSGSFETDPCPLI